MTSSSINTTRKNVSLDFIRKTAGYIAGATGGYISEVMPVSTSAISGAKNGLQELNATFSNAASTIVPKINQLKTQGGFKTISNWFMQKENDFSDFGDIDTQLNFDVDTDSSEIAETQISESMKNANQISKTVLESSHRLVESQVSATANLIASTDRQTAVISSGFDKTNDTLNKILEVLTKNTATLIETTVANHKDQSSNDKLASSGKFRFDDYKNMVGSNIKNSQVGMLAGILSMASGMGGMITPKDLIQIGIGAGINKIAPNMKNNMKALDSAVNDVVMGSLIRLGEHRNDRGKLGALAQIFGIDSTRKDISTQRSSLELKAVPFDSIAKESLVGALPGYLRHILIAVGGPDLTYDFKSRSFKGNGAIKKEFRDQAISSTRGSLNNAGNNIKNAIGNDKFSSMIYDLMMNELGTRTSNGGARNTISKFGNKDDAQNYILQTVLSGMKLSDSEVEAAKKFANNLGKASTGVGSHQIMNQVTRNNVNRNKSMQQYVSDADAYGMDLSFINDSASADRKAIAKSYGKDITSSDSKVNVSDPVAHLKGSNYTNMALYEIYRRLNEGINVFQVGSAKKRKNPFEKLGDDYLTRPLGHRPKQTKSSDTSSVSDGGGMGAVLHDDGSNNLLQNQELEDGTIESLSGGQRFTRWGKQRGGNLAKAMFSGNTDQVKEAFGLIVRDVTQVGGDQLKKGLARVNDSFGNVSGYMKHKLFGTGYSYDSGETDKDGNPIKVRIKDNQGGGVFGVVQDNITSMFKNSKEKSMKWFKDVAGYFDYRGTGNSPEDRGMEAKRKSFLFSSVGAMAGMGMLGGPLGLLFGAVAGNALSATGIGDKIKSMLFGKDYEDDKGNKKHKLGLIERAVDGVVDPIKYQIGKSFNLLGKVMKKNVLGPLSDIGLAIKGRITDAVSETSKTAFGKVFGFIGKMMMMPFKAITSTAKMPINLMGSMFRGMTGAAGSAVGSTLGLTASMLATKDDRALISQRRSDRNTQIEEDYKNDYSGGYSAWKTSQDERRRNNWGKLKDATSEERMSQEELLEYNKKIEEHSAETAEATSTLARLGSEEGSIYTHDQGLHGRLDQLIELMGGGKSSKKGTSSEDKAFVDSIIGATGSMMSTEGIVSMEEARLGTSIIDEAAKNNPSKSSVISKFKTLIGVQSKRKDEDPNKKESWFTKLLKTLSENWSGLLAGAIGALTLFNSDFRGFALGILDKFGVGIKNLADYIWNGDKDKKDKNAIVNTITAPLDMKTNYVSDYLNPFSTISHVRGDAAGNDITNINATRAKDAPLHHLAAQEFARSAGSIGYGVDKKNAFEAAKAAKLSGDMEGYKSNMAKAADYSRISKGLAENPMGRGGSTVIKGMQNFGVGLLGGQMIGKGAGFVASKVLQNAGVSEEWADRGGRIAETGATIKGTMAITKSAATENGTVNKLLKWAAEKSEGVLEGLSQKVASSKYFSAAAKPVSEFVGKAKGTITERALAPFIETISRLAAKTGVQVTAGVLTAGVANAVMAGAGAIIQGLNTEELFGVLPGEADALMKTIATGLGAIFNLPFVCLVEIIDVVLAPMNGGKGIRQTLAEIIYNSLNGDNGASLSDKQSHLTNDLNNYNQKYGTNLDKSTYNDMINQGMLDKIWTGGTKTEDGHAVFNEKGERVTNGGIKGAISTVKNKANNEYTWASNKVNEFWSGKNEVDENGQEIKDEDGNTVKNGGLKQWGLKTIGKFTSTVGTIFTGVGSIAKDWLSGEYERDENGDPLIDENGNPVRKGGLEDWAIAGINKVISTITTPVKDMVKGATDWLDNESAWASQKLASAGDWVSAEFRSFWNPIGDSLNGMVTSGTDWINNESAWAKGQFKSAAEYVSEKVSSIFTTITIPINQFVDGAREWVTSKSDWGVDGVKEWIGKKADSAWDYISTPFKGLFSKGQQEQKDLASISNKGGKGGGLDETIKPSVPKLGGIGGPAESGDPLNKPFEVTSPFGERVHPVTGERKFHKGVDLVPADGGDAQVGAVYGGKVTAVGYEEGGAGNYVFYQTNDGMTIKNMHMKDGSIPSNIVEGASIKPGDKLGDMGTTGASTGPHLHYQIEKNGEAIDPAPYVEGGKTFSSFNSSAPGGGGAAKSSGPLGTLLGNIQNAGNAYLNKISGGLLGNKGSNQSSISSPGGGGAKFAGLTGTDVPERVYNFLRSKGCSHEAAIGILANMQQESGIDPAKQQVGGPAKGIVQWEGGRFDSMAQFAADHGKDWSDLESQLEFLWGELSSDDISGRMSGSIAPTNLSALGVQGIPGGFSGFKSINDAKYATALFEGAFERAGEPMMENRYGAISALDERLRGNGGNKGGKGGGLEEMISNSMKKVTSGIGGKIRGSTENQSEGFVKNNVVSNFNSSTKPATAKVFDFSPNTAPLTPHTENAPISSNTSNPMIQDVSQQPQSDGTSRLEAILIQVLAELKSINGHTENSSSQLENLNQKDFVDNGVRDSISSLGKAKPKRSPQIPYNHGNTRSVNAMIRP